ncbi:MAG: hypothetical protein IKQ34_02595 [Bacilli bacterium]|nr:hypothetical protein [Bacilli bacterium]
MDEAFSDHPNAMEIMMSNSVQVFDKDSTSLRSIAEPESAEEIIYRAEHGENVLFAFSQEDCSSCERFMKNAGNRLWQTKYRITLIGKEIKEEAAKISKYVVDNELERMLAHPISGGTPSLYIMNNEKIVELVYGSNKDDDKIVATALKEYVKGGNVYHSDVSGWYSSFSRHDALIEGPTYVLSEASKDDFYKNVFPIVSKSDKKFNVIGVKSYDENSAGLNMLRGCTGTNDLEGKLLYVDLADKSTITIIDDVQSYLKENYVSSSL